MGPRRCTRPRPSASRSPSSSAAPHTRIGAPPPARRATGSSGSPSPRRSHSTPRSACGTPAARLGRAADRPRHARRDPRQRAARRRSTTELDRLPPLARPGQPRRRPRRRRVARAGPGRGSGEPRRARNRGRLLRRRRDWLFAAAGGTFSTMLWAPALVVATVATIDCSTATCSYFALSAALLPPIAGLGWWVGERRLTVAVGRPARPRPSCTSSASTPRPPTSSAASDRPRGVPAIRA